MEKVLNITNGDSAVEIMQQAGVIGDFLPWRDILHDGPVPDGLSLDELSKLRAEFISENGWGTLENITASFIERDNTLKSVCDASLNPYEKVILWFEHDLYDQLQIIQILDWFNAQCMEIDAESFSLSIICVDQYLGLLTPDEMKNLVKYEASVTNKHLALSTKSWSAFRSNNPEEWNALLELDTSILPFLEGAVIRALEEYPSYKNGLTRTEKQILKIVSQGESDPWRVFKTSQESESRIFIGDSSFWKIIEGLLSSSKSATPLLQMAEEKTWSSPPKPNKTLKITKDGEAVLSGNQNYLDLKEIDYWIGGVHLTADNLWCWDSKTKQVLRKE